MREALSHQVGPQRFDRTAAAALHACAHHGAPSLPHRSDRRASTALQPLPCMHVLTTAPRPFPTGRTAALRPIDAPEGAWRVADGSNGWKDVPSVRLLTEAAMAQVIATDCP